MRAQAMPLVSLRVSPEAWIPYGNYANGSDIEDFSIGGGVDLNADMSFFGFMSPFLETGYNFIPLANVS